MLKQIVTFLVAAAVLLTVTPVISAATFRDVRPDHSLYTEIEYLSSKGVINGYPDGTFKPNELMVKKHIAKMLVTALDLQKTNMKPLPYKDVPRSHIYYEDIAAAYTAGIFGHADYFKPDSTISRAFMAKLIAASFDLKSIAEYAVTYVDVPTSDPFYRPIQLVAMNDIARGYEIANGYGAKTYAFAPTNLLTRAHFSAFLARAMSLTTGNYAPDTNYTYFYDTMYEETFRMEMAAQDDRTTTWNVYNDVTNELHAQHYYTENANYWSEAISNEVIHTYVRKPFTIGFKYYAYLEDYDVHQYRYIVETKETYNIDEQVYRDVVVVRDVYWNETMETYSDHVLYIAKFHGVIAYEQNGDIHRWLVERIAN